MYDVFSSFVFPNVSIFDQRNIEENGPDAWLVTNTAARSQRSPGVYFCSAPSNRGFWLSIVSGKGDYSFQ